ncbi:ribosome recycling factor [Buchnera aphidicola (Mindarus keteleerifoliae)]|uniref:ribosome recycling factor n=1 Tax=Buchnera aphidicola TaxID=9 RepID=UPI0031B6CCC0
MIENIWKYIDENMEKCILQYQINLKKIRTGRVSTDILDDIFIDYYGKKMKLRNIANIVIENSNMLKVTPFENNIQRIIEKKIISSNLGLNPVSIENNILVKIPFLTEDRRRELIKIAKNDAEKTRIKIRNIRKNAKYKIKKLLNEKIISKDKDHSFQNKLQVKTNFFIDKIDNMLKEKEQELMKF